MLIKRIQQDLFDFIDHDPELLDGLIQFWYMANSNALSAALTKLDGLKLIVNVEKFDHFEALSKKLFLVADTLVLRDTRKRTKDELLGGLFPIPTDYKPKYLDEVISELQQLRPSPLTITDRPSGLWTSDVGTLNNGYEVAWAFQESHCIPKEFTNWITGNGRKYIETGSIVYAPFIPPIEFELEFLKNDLSLPAYFNGMPCFHQNYEWLDSTSLNSLLSLKFPFIDNIDIETINKVKQDNYDEFQNFSSSLLKSVSKVKGLLGSTDFVKEVKYIQKNEIDDNISKLDQKVKRIANMSSLRKFGIVTGLAGLNGAMYLGAATPTLITGLAASAIAMIMEKVTELKERGDLKDNNSYFLWKLGAETK